MRFQPNGPDVPAELIAAQEKGSTIFVCGAGVSRGVGLPLFRGLVEGVYSRLGEDWSLHTAENEGMRDGGSLEGQYDRVLRCLERRLAASDAPRNRGMRERIRSAVRDALMLPDDADLANHLILLELSRDAEGRHRILTTNFDTLFERAWFDQHRVAIASHAGMAMPQPKVAGCTGVLHLHGRLADPRAEIKAVETDLVLTSAEFGDAYLRSGWASRYIYDLVRAYTLVLVGYQADDPPMRYLLEALEADRERYPDLQKVYAFASFQPGAEGLIKALWEAKAVEPILYPSQGEDHSALYTTLSEWRRYADDPTAWRRERLRRVLAEVPAACSETQTHECAGLLGHGDAGQLLGELDPDAAWLPVLAEQNVFSRAGGLPGLWISKRINDPEMIRACTKIDAIDEQARWQISQGMEREQANLSATRMRAWRLLVAAKRSKSSTVFDDNWYSAAENIKRGQADFESRRLISRILRPRLDIQKSYPWYDQERAATSPETLHHLLRIEFNPSEHPSVGDILAVWSRDLDAEIALFRTLDRTLLDALEEANDLGLFDGWDRTSFDVPSVARHPQNAHHSGFYPLVRALADLWQRIVEQDISQGRALIVSWANSAILLIRRLALFALEHRAFAPAEVAVAIRALDDKIFWSSGAQVEIMRVLVARWNEIALVDRQAIEVRICQGVPRSMYPDSAFEDEEGWMSIRDSSVYRRLERIRLAGGHLTDESQKLLAEISATHPEWRPGAGDRDDFHVWHESGHGPDGQPELLAAISDDRLVQEAMRLQREHRFEQRDVWRIFCSADPGRALRGLTAEAENDHWDPETWRSLLWAAMDKGAPEFQLHLADILLTMPNSTLRDLLPVTTSWLQRHHALLSAADNPDGPRFLPLWDRFAGLAFVNEVTAPETGGDVLTESLNRPGGMLAWSLLDILSRPKPKRDSRLPPELRPRFDRLLSAVGRPGLLARVYLARTLAYLDAIDHNWTNESFTERLAWGHPEALALWRAFAHSGVVSAPWFNILKPTMLAAFERNELSDNEFEDLAANLLSIGIWHQRGEGADYNLSFAEIRRALTVGPSSVRRNVAWNLWRLMEGEEEDALVNGAARWRSVVGPLFSAIWPLDARLRSKGATQNLVMMVLDAGDAFPEAVEAILDIIVPYELYQIAHSLRLENRHSELVRRFPLAFVRLANALIDPAKFPVPSDLATMLEECIAADATIAREPAYVRLFGLRRQRNA